MTRFPVLFIALFAFGGFTAGLSARTAGAAPAPAPGKAPTRPSEDPRWNSYSEEVKNQKRQGWAVDKMKKGLGPDFRVETLPPYVIGANCSEERLGRIKNEVCTAFSNAVRGQFRMSHTRHDKRVYVFKKGSDDYQEYAAKLFGGAPAGAAAFAIPSERALLVPDGPGGLGTIQHELVHLLIRDEVKNPAIWFDEGFAALFEQAKPDPSGGKVVVNRHWRLEPAQEAVKSGRVALSALTRLKYEQFRGKNENDHYCVGAMVFLCLQDQGGLDGVVQAYAETFAADPSGRKAIEKASGKPFDAFERDWREWLMKKRNPPREEKGSKEQGPDPVSPPPVAPPTGGGAEDGEGEETPP